MPKFHKCGPTCTGRGTPAPGKNGDFLLLYYANWQEGETLYLCRRLNAGEAEVLFQYGRDMGAGKSLSIGPGTHWTIELLGTSVSR